MTGQLGGWFRQKQEMVLHQCKICNVTVSCLGEDYHYKQPQRYQGYKEGSGRAGFLRRTWGGKP